MKVFDYIQQGGPVMYILVLLNIVGLSLLVWKVIEILGASKNPQELATLVQANLDENFSKLSDQMVIVEVAKEEISSRIQKLESGLSTIKIIATISPLLGLLGTVIGILLSFRVISQQGLSNNSLFAEGISIALITTVGGLIVSIPHTVGYHYLISLLDKLEGQLEKITLRKYLGNS